MLEMGRMPFYSSGKGLRGWTWRLDSRKFPGGTGSATSAPPGEVGSCDWGEQEVTRSLTLGSCSAGSLPFGSQAGVANVTS